MKCWDIQYAVWAWQKHSKFWQHYKSYIKSFPILRYSKNQWSKKSRHTKIQKKTFCISHIYSLREYAYKHIDPWHCCYSILYLMLQKQTKKEKKWKIFCLHQSKREYWSYLTQWQFVKLIEEKFCVESIRISVTNTFTLETCFM